MKKSISILQKSDFIPALKQGALLGGLTGIVAVALPGGVVLAGGAVLAASFAGAGLGAFISSIVGSRIGNR